MRDTSLKEIAKEISIYSDGADLAAILWAAGKEYISGITTNPSLMRKAGVKDYEAFARTVLEKVRDKPVSFEVLSDEWRQMRREALQIAAWGKNVNVKVPITNTRGESNLGLVNDLCREGVTVNVTAVMTKRQIDAVYGALPANAKAIVSIFAGRVADTGRNAVGLVGGAVNQFEGTYPRVQILWASTREVYNIVQARDIGCHIITVPADILAKAEKTLGADDTALSLETVRMFDTDAKAAGYSIFVDEGEPGPGR